MIFIITNFIIFIVIFVNFLLKFCLIITYTDDIIFSFLKIIIKLIKIINITKYVI
jgi:hypothetical protein